MSQLHSLTIRLPTFEMEILKRAAVFQNTTPEQFVVKQLNLSEMQELFDFMIRNASQGYIGAIGNERCSRCQWRQPMGAGATLCHYCEHNFPDRCPDELHERFATLSQSDENTSFHCNVCNAWVVVEHISSTTSGTTDLVSQDETGKKTYRVELEDSHFKAVDFFIEQILSRIKNDLADRLRPYLDRDGRAINGITDFELNMLTSHMKGYMDFLSDDGPSGDQSYQKFIDEFTGDAKSAIESIHRSVQEQDNAVGFAND